MRRRARVREGPLAELFRATEHGGPRGGPRRSPARASSQLPVVSPALAILLVGVIAAAALALSVWQLAHSGTREPTAVTVLAAVGPTTASAGPTEQKPTGEAPPAAATQVAEQGPERATSPSVEPAAKRVALGITAARGDCWLEVRVGSASGRLLFAATLRRGESRRFAGRRLWVAFGAGGNLDVRLNGRRVEGFPAGTAVVIVTAKGVRGPV